MVNELVEAADERTLSRVIARYGRVDLLCLDELGYLSLDTRGAELLFQILTDREEKRSVAVASNAPFSEWGRTFTDARLAGACRSLDVPFAHHRDRIRLLPAVLLHSCNHKGTSQAKPRCIVSDTPMSSPRRNHYLEPSTGDDTAAVLDEAVASLGTLRMPTRWLGDSGVELHLLASLMAEAERRLPIAVAGARDQEYSWAEIGDLLGTTRAAAWQRFAHRAQIIQKEIRRQLLDNPD